jgi:hypothetical protein
MTRHALVAVSALVSGLMLATPGLAAAQDRDRQSRDNKRRKLPRRASRGLVQEREKPRKCGASGERLKGFEPSTFCMASKVWDSART